MNQRSLAALIFLNLALLVALLVAVVPTRPVEAQSFSGGGFLMIAGNVKARQQDVIYIVNMGSGEVASLLYNGSSSKFEFLGRRNFSNDGETPSRNR
ncbi:hypothetical protein [Poriferisphaera sp. WC338]|uniref:hypothetical protein n=1 Tax=Poriferisphaera sp. WC338 TaxID=3425129 RepID=UPI003D8192AE